MSTVPTTVHLTPTVARAVEIAAMQAGRSVSGFCRDICHRHVYGDEPSTPKVAHAPDRSAFTYLVRCAGFYKIGRARDVEKRLRGMTLPECELIASVNDAALESVLHKKFRHRRARGEWFRLTTDDIEEIKQAFAST